MAVVFTAFFCENYVGDHVGYFILLVHEIQVWKSILPLLFHVC